MRIAILNGPNLNLLGKREPEIYGSQNFDDFLAELKSSYPDHELIYRQSNHEGDLVDELQKLDAECDGIILNPAAYSHSSIAIADAVAAISCPVVEVHISNIHQRESFRKHSFVSAQARGVIAGLGLKGYELAMQYLLEKKS